MQMQPYTRYCVSRTSGKLLSYPTKVLGLLLGPYSPCHGAYDAAISCLSDQSPLCVWKLLPCTEASHMSSTFIKHHCISVTIGCTNSSNAGNTNHPNVEFTD